MDNSPVEDFDRISYKGVELTRFLAQAQVVAIVDPSRPKWIGRNGPDQGRSRG